MNELAQHTVERLEYAFEVSRRDLFKLLGAGLVVGLCAPTALTQESGNRTRGESTPQDVNSWLHINTDGKVTSGQKLVKIIGQDTPLTPAAQWRIAGTSVQKADGRAFVTGAHQYTSDMTRLKMLSGKVLRPKSFNATLVSLDSRAAEKLPNVRVIHDGSFVGVVAPEQETAQKAISLLQAQWDSPAQPSETELFEYLKNNPESNSESFGGRANHETGS